MRTGSSRPSRPRFTRIVLATRSAEAEPRTLPQPVAAAGPGLRRPRRNQPATGSRRKLLGPPLHTERARPRAPRQADRAGRVRLRQPLVVGLRHRGDPAACSSRSIGVAAFALVVPDHRRPARRARLPDPLLPPDDQGVPDRRRRLHRHPGQLRPAARRRSPASPCSPTTSSPSRCRSRPAPPRWRRPFPALAPYHVPIAVVFVVVIAFGNLRGRQGVGQGLRRPDLLLHRQHGRAARRRRRTGWSSPALPPGSTDLPGMVHDRHTPGTGLLDGRRAVRRAARRSPPAARRSPASRPSPTACPRSREPEWKNARTTLVIMGALLGVMFLGLSILAAKMHAGALRSAARRRSSPRSARSSTAAAPVGHVPLLPACRPARCSSWSWRPTPASPTSPGWPASTPATTSCPASSPSGATGWCSPTASSPWPCAADRRC